ncbi:MAG: 5-(carboxyamino)imidazole ribonucleotide synthase [Xanthomonadales bacterium]|nr:N5-carboxyaminoimidazole ribonucleotide synthase [Xanthomonadales bacterium]MCC6593864.1 5-(carboxyamino)imidazole ribonucleotide synthase [Xanthomonadales bacterium]MCE7929928.1 5-(carboxyamino)imidazole ribonucleotide synthase [Xanthomonadales bacterium PRO6]
MRVGVIGGGQLARMLALAGAPLGVRVHALDPAVDACSGGVAPLEVAAFDDLAALHRFADVCDAITFDFENVSAPALHELEVLRPVRPNPLALATAQDRGAEKVLFVRVGTGVAPFAVVEEPAHLAQAVATVAFPAILKTRRFGYDGKGQIRVDCADLLEDAWTRLGRAACVLETRIAFERELSIVAVRALDGELRCYPLVENLHVDGILSATLAPAVVDPALAQQAESCARRVGETLDYVGVFAIEFFDVGGRLLANEMAPRVHNSGHWSIEGAITGQFENHLRAVAGLPLGDTAARGLSCMLNWIGELPERNAALRVPGLHWHDYGKAARAGRKVGHATITAADRGELRRRLALVADLLGRHAQIDPVLARLG